MNTKPPFPIIEVEGGPYDRGCQYGKQARTIIEDSVDNYHRVFKERGATLEWDEITALAKQFERPIQEYDPEVIEEMKGIADGSGVKYEDILILNVRTEFLAVGMGEKISASKEPEGCTVIVATPEVTANHHMLMAQNQDSSPSTQKALVIVKKKKEKGRPNTVGFHEAGMIIKTGFNSAGIVCLGNGLYAEGKVQPGVSVQMLVHGILTAENLNSGVRRCLPAKRTTPSNKVIGSAEGLCVDVEVGQDYENFLLPEDGILVHTNHFVVPNPKQSRDLGPLKFPNTLTRRYRALQLLTAERGHITADTFKKVLTDHFDKPDSVCTHVNPQSPLIIMTTMSVIIDITAKTVDLAKGPPCENEYVHLDFQDMF